MPKEKRPVGDQYANITQLPTLVEPRHLDWQKIVKMIKVKRRSNGFDAPLLLVTLKLENMMSLLSGEGSQGQFSEQGVNPSRLLYQECLQNHPPTS
ncbi:hypothetical protein BC941DRAFT_475714 [Chlamydoabsidia padenii]|nr:hypothetical protein BC941DRAFT_475714 [Chlamydoabsidia padenii]